MTILSRIPLPVRILVIGTLGLITVAFLTKFVSSTAQTPNEERELDNRVPDHLPIKVKIKKEKEKAFKDSQNEHWARDFELEVKNTGDRAIYHLSLVILLPEVVMPDGNPYGFGLRLGRIDFVRDIGTVPQPEDVTIKPGETYVFTIPSKNIQGWENWALHEKIRSPKRIMLLFDFLSYGDDTGFEGPAARPLKRKRQVGLIEQKNKSDPQNCEQPQITAFSLALNSVSFIPAKLFLDTEPITIKSSAPDICCPGTSCAKIKRQFGRCYCSDPEDLEVNDKEFSVTTSCTDPAGACGTTVSFTESCNNPCCNIPLFCTHSRFVPCGDSIPEPSPSPTASPEVSCDPATRPNPSCACEPTPGGQGNWTCFCLQGAPANYILYPNSGGCKPGTSVNNGSDCCVCSAPQDCGEGRYWDKYFCQCNDVATPTPTPTPTPPNEPTGCESWDRYWNFQSPGCYLEPQLCPGHCSPYFPLESGGCETSVDYCQFNYGCSFGFTDGGSGCCCGATPIVIDIAGNGFSLTDPYSGVFFDMGGDGRKEPIAWTSSGSDDAWLTLDRNGNGIVDSSKEMFGNLTDQPHATTSLNGFMALAEFDRPENGGNNDTLIDVRDGVFGSLRLWQDVNRNGVSEIEELHTLTSLGVAGIDLKFKEAKKADQHGNQFSYRAKVMNNKGNQLGRWAWDVTLRVNPPPR